MLFVPEQVIVETLGVGVAPCGPQRGEGEEDEGRDQVDQRGPHHLNP